MTTALVFVLIVVIGASAAFCQHGNDKHTASEKWRTTIEKACIDCDLDTTWTDALVAMMVVESGGDTDVSSVLGVSGDVMQAAEGAYGWIVSDGWPEYDIDAETVKASIYAGVLEFKQSLELWQDYLGTIDPDDYEQVQLVVQGYNFGAEGWCSWCAEQGITAYSVETAQRYSDEMMPEEAKGTYTHADKWLTAYKTIRGTS